MARKESIRNTSGEAAPPVRRARTRKSPPAPVYETAAPAAVEQPAQPATEPAAITVAEPAPPQPARAFAATVSGASVEIDHEEIARLAHSYWEARGCQGGSPEEDWLRAEQELRDQHRK